MTSLSSIAEHGSLRVSCGCATRVLDTGLQRRLGYVMDSRGSWPGTWLSASTFSISAGLFGMRWLSVWRIRDDSFLSLLRVFCVCVILARNSRFSALYSRGMTSVECNFISSVFHVLTILARHAG